MTARIILGIVLLLASLPAASAQHTAGVSETWRAIADTRDFDGQIVRPRICPADSSLIAFEIRGERGPQLYLYNLKTTETRRMRPPGKDNVFEESGPLQDEIDRHIAWCPVKMGTSKVWAAFVSNVSGSEALYTYDVYGDKYYLMRFPDDSLGIAKTSYPSWSPDGNCLTYTTRLSGNSEIHQIRNMPKVLQDPGNSTVNAKYYSGLVTDRYGVGDQYLAVWCPVPGSGLLVYHFVPENRERILLLAFDVLSETAKSYEIGEMSPANSYFNAGWNPNGQEVAYHIGKAKPGRSVATGEVSPDEAVGDSYGLGISAVKLIGDSLVIKARINALTKQTTVIDVAPGYDLHTPPAWLPDSRHMLIPMFDEPQKNPLKTLDPYEWTMGSSRVYWLSSFGGGSFPFPRDVDVVGRNIVFTFSKGQTRTLLCGCLMDRESYFEPISYLDITRKRQKKWDSYSTQYEPGLLKRFGNWAIDPLVGPDIIVNRPVVITGIAVLWAILNGNGPPPPPSGVTNWNPPGWPDKP